MPRLLRNMAMTFTPADFIIVMGTGISSDILYAYPYEGFWLRRASYPMFAVACLCMFYFQILFLLNVFYYIKENSIKEYLNEYYRNPTRSLFWGAYPMGWVTIINYMVNLVIHDSRISTQVKKRLLKTCYVLWWYDVGLSLLTAWFINFFIIRDFYSKDSKGDYPTLSSKIMSKNLQSIILLPIVPIVVACSCSANFTMLPLFTETFGRRIQSLNLIITALLWCQAVLFVFILVSMYFWNLYVNKIPPLGAAFSLFIVLGPLGQASYGILLLTNDTILYAKQYFPIPQDYLNNDDDFSKAVLILSIPWAFKAIGLFLSFFLLGFGYFYSMTALFSFCHYATIKNPHPNKPNKFKRIYHFNKGWWGMTFPMGTMSLGSTQVFVQFNQYIPMKTFHVIGAIYGTICILWSLLCCMCALYFTVIPFIIDHLKVRKELKELEEKEQEFTRKLTLANIFHRK